MALPLSVAQLLINQSELDEIYHIINSAKDPDVKIVGSLFGLWRNSLFQPVVHLVTGPGKKAKISKSTFGPDYNYNHDIKKCLKEDHGLLQIGLWCSGNANRYPRRKCNKNVLSYFNCRIISGTKTCTQSVTIIKVVNGLRV